MRGFQNFKNSVNLFGPHSAVLFDPIGPTLSNKDRVMTLSEEENFLMMQDDDVTIPSFEEWH